MRKQFYILCVVAFYLVTNFTDIYWIIVTFATSVGVCVRWVFPRLQWNRWTHCKATENETDILGGYKWQDDSIGEADWSSMEERCLAPCWMTNAANPWTKHDVSERVSPEERHFEGHWIHFCSPQFCFEAFENSPSSGLCTGATGQSSILLR